MLIQGDYRIFLMWLVIGIIAAMLLQALDPGKVKGGLFSTTLSALIGSIAGGAFSNIYFRLKPTAIDTKSILVSIAGAFLISALYRLSMKDNSHIRTQTLQMK